MRLTESLNLTIDQAGLENLTMSESKKDQLKAAFLLYCNGNMGHATSIIEDLFPVSEGASISSAEPDASMDRLVVAISTDLIDDQVWSAFTRASTFQAFLRQVLLRDVSLFQNRNRVLKPVRSRNRTRILVLDMDGIRIGIEKIETGILSQCQYCHNVSSMTEKIDQFK